jgi:hypothetical protein
MNADITPGGLLWLLMAVNVALGLGALGFGYYLLADLKKARVAAQSAAGFPSALAQTVAESVQARVVEAIRELPKPVPFPDLEELSGFSREALGKVEQGVAEVLARLPSPGVAPAAGAGASLESRSAFVTLAWPPFFLGGSLGPWRKRIEAAIALGDSAGFALFLALGRFNTSIRDAADRRKVADALHGVSIEAYRFWKTQGVPSLDAALEWRAAFQVFLDSSGIRLEVILALERDRFDMESMLAADSGTASRMYVKEALSWIVRDKSSEVSRVLCHARVVTG